MKSCVYVFNRNGTRIDVITNKIPTDVDMEGSTRSSVIMAEIDGTSVVTVKDHRMVQIQMKFLNDVLDEKHPTQTH